MARYPTAFGHALGAADLAVRGAIEVAIVGEPSDERFRALASAVAERYLPSLVLAGGEGARRRESRCSRDAAATRRWRTCAARTRATRRRATSSVLAAQLEAIVAPATALDRSSLRRCAPSVGVPQVQHLIAPPCGASHLRSEFRSYSFISHVSDVSGLPKVSWTSSRIIV